MPIEAEKMILLSLWSFIYTKFQTSIYSNYENMQHIRLYIDRQEQQLIIKK